MDELVVRAEREPMARGIRTAGGECSVAGYRYGPARIDVEADDADAARWLQEFLTPWFEACPPGASEFSVRLTGSASAFDALERRQAAATLQPRACFALDSQVIELPGWTDAGGTVIADSGRSCFYQLRRGGVEIVARPGIRRVRIGLMRVMREMAALRMLGEVGCLDLHAAAFAVEDRAVLLVGPKRAGKTTLLVNALRSGRASLLANDRVFVETSRSPCRAFGVPTLVSIRPDTLENFPGLASSVSGGSALLHTGEIEAYAACGSGEATPRKFALSPAQLAQQLGARTVRCAPIAAIVFPEICPTQSSWSLAPVAPEDAAGRLRENLYGARLGPRSRTVFEDIVDSRPHRRREPAERLDRLAAWLPMFACRLGPDAYRDGAEAWLRALPLETAP